MYAYFFFCYFSPIYTSFTCWPWNFHFYFVCVCVCVRVYVHVHDCMILLFARPCNFVTDSVAVAAIWSFHRMYISSFGHHHQQHNSGSRILFVIIYWIRFMKIFLKWFWTKYYCFVFYVNMKYIDMYYGGESPEYYDNCA